jgi:hypothetical protein
MKTVKQHDFISRSIAAVVPAIVGETIKRTKNNVDNLSNYVEEISADILKHCGDVDLDPNYLHITNLKLDLQHLYNEFIEDIKKQVINELKSDVINDIKDDIKEELQVEMQMNIQLQLNALREQISSVAEKKSTSTVSEFNFSLDGGKLKPVSKGYESIAHMAPKKELSSKQIEENLKKNNPMFARLTETLNRQQSGKPSYSEDGYIEARKDRMDPDSINVFKESMTTAKFEYDDDENPEEDEKWNKLFSSQLDK